MKDIKTVVCTCGGKFKLDFNNYPETINCPKCNFEYTPYFLIGSVKSFLENKLKIVNLQEIKLTENNDEKV